MIDPILAQIGPFTLYWYGLMYVLGFLFSYVLLSYLRKDSLLSKDQFETAFLWIMISSVIGGRIGYILFYNLPFYLSNPEFILRVDMGGMSIHGGLLGAALGVFFLARKFKKSFYELSDFFVLPAGFGLAFGRIGNFINQELIGTTTNSPFGVRFESVDNALRHPYQLYASAKNLLIFHVLLYLKLFKQMKPGILTLYFILLYNLGRFILDFYREPTISLGIISLGQVLCLVFILVSSYFLWKLSTPKN